MKKQFVEAEKTQTDQQEKNVDPVAFADYISADYGETMKKDSFTVMARQGTFETKDDRLRRRRPTRPYC